MKKPAINFRECNIPVGSELVYVDDNNIKVIVVDDHKVQYNEQITSLSAIAKDKKGYSVAGPSLFTYNGEIITKIAERTQWKNL